MENIAEKLKEFRRVSGKSQEDFASSIGIAQKTWSNYENGKTRPPMKVLFDLAERGYIIKGLTSNFMDDWSEEKKREFNRRMAILKTGAFPLDLPLDDFARMVKAVDDHPSSSTRLPAPEEKHPLVSNFESLIKENIAGIVSRLEAVESSLKSLQAKKNVPEPEPEYPTETGSGDEYISEPEPGYESASLAFYDCVAAGPPIGQSDDNGQYVEVSLRFIKTKPDDYYVMRVRGNSMIDALIPDGSLVLIKKSDVPENGKIQLVRIDSGSTLKRMREEEDHSWTLCYEDGTGRTIPLGEDNQVQGNFEAVLPPYTRPRIRVG